MITLSWCVLTSCRFSEGKNDNLVLVCVDLLCCMAGIQRRYDMVTSPKGLNVCGI